jgi:hypothetical protein
MLNKKKALFVILLLVVSSIALLSAQPRWIQYGSVTIHGYPAQNTLITLQIRHATTGNWITPHGVPPIRTDSSGNWFQTICPTLHPHSVFDQIKATATFKRCHSCADFVGSEAVPYDINNLIGIDIILGISGACLNCQYNVGNPPFISW